MSDTYYKEINHKQKKKSYIYIIDANNLKKINRV